MFIVVVIALSCVVVLFLVVIGSLIWRLRRAASRSDNNPKHTSKHTSDAVESPRDQKVTEPGSYMELKHKLSDGLPSLPPIPSEYQSLQEKSTTSVYENVAYDKAQQDGEEVYVDILIIS